MEERNGNSSMNQSHMACGVLIIQIVMYFIEEEKKENRVFSIDDFSEVACMV